MNQDQINKYYAGSTAIAVRWGDLDAMNHVNNSRFFTFMEQVRVEWLNRCGWQEGRLEGGPVLANAACEFLKPVMFPANLEVRLYFGTPGRSSLPTYYEIINTSAGGECCATGQALMVWINRMTGRSMPLPDEVRAQLKNLRENISLPQGVAPLV